MKVRRVSRLAVLILALGMVSCAGSSVYVPVDNVTKSRGWSDTDVKQMAAGMYASLQKKLEELAPPGSPKLIVALLPISNKTSEHIDTDVLSDDLQIEMLRAGSLRFVDRTKLKEISKEFDLGGSGLVDPSTVKRAGSVLGADLLLTGEMTGITKSVGNKQLSYYRLSMRLLQVSTDEVVWAEKYEIKKGTNKNILDW